MGGLLGFLGDALGTNSNQQVNTPQTDPNAFNYGGSPNGAKNAQQMYQNDATAAGNRQGAQINNQYNTRDQANTQSVFGSQGNLQNYYQGVLSGTQPSMAQAQMNAATDQSINAQMAMANSAKGSLQGASAQRNAALQGAQMQQNAAQQSMIGRIQEQQNAAQGMNQLLNNQGQLALNEQQLNANSAYQQAGLQQQQNALNNQAELAYSQQGQQVAMAQLQAQENEQQLNSQNALTAQGQSLGQSMGNASANMQLLGGGAQGAGGFLGADIDLGGGHYRQHFADADLSEPGGPAHWTLREEDNFILAKNQRSGELRKLVTAPLSDREFKQAMARHGAGPLGAEDPRRIRTVANDDDLMASQGYTRPLPTPPPQYSAGNWPTSSPVSVRPAAGPPPAYNPNTMTVVMPGAPSPVAVDRARRDIPASYDDLTYGNTKAIVGGAAPPTSTSPPVTERLVMTDPAAQEAKKSKSGETDDKDEKKTTKRKLGAGLKAAGAVLQSPSAAYQFAPVNYGSLTAIPVITNRYADMDMAEASRQENINPDNPNGSAAAEKKPQGKSGFGNGLSKFGAALVSGGPMTGAMPQTQMAPLAPLPTVSNPFADMDMAPEPAPTMQSAMSGLNRLQQHYADLDMKRRRY